MAVNCSQISSVNFNAQDVEEKKYVQSERLYCNNETSLCCVFLNPKNRVCNSSPGVSGGSTWQIAVRKRGYTELKSSYFEEISNRNMHLQGYIVLYFFLGM